MPVQRDGAGRRFVAVDVEAPGTPPEIWQAIATGPGISAWFVPTEIDGRVGGEIVSHFGPDPGMAARTTITEWEPPLRFVAEGAGFGPHAPALATEWTCSVRLGARASCGWCIACIRIATSGMNG